MIPVKERRFFAGIKNDTFFGRGGCFSPLQTTSTCAEAKLWRSLLCKGHALATHHRQHGEEHGEEKRCVARRATG